MSVAQKQSTLVALSLGLIGSASAQKGRGEGVQAGDDFDKQIRRKPLAFAADSVCYWRRMSLWYPQHPTPTGAWLKSLVTRMYAADC